MWGASFLATWPLRSTATDLAHPSSPTPLQPCSICHRAKQGAVVPCSDCHDVFHVACAHKTGYLLGMEISLVCLVSGPFPVAKTC